MTSSVPEWWRKAQRLVAADPLLEAIEAAEVVYRAETRTGPLHVTLHYHNGLRKLAVIETERRVGGNTRIVVEDRRIDYTNEADRAVSSLK